MARGPYVKIFSIGEDERPFVTAFPNDQSADTLDTASPFLPARCFELTSSFTPIIV